MTSVFSKTHDDRLEAAWKAKKWMCYAKIKKPESLSGFPEYHYLTLKDMPAGKAAVLQKIANEQDKKPNK